MRHCPALILAVVILITGIPAKAVENITVTREQNTVSREQNIELLSGSITEVRRRYTRLSHDGHDVFLDEPDLFPPSLGPPPDAELGLFRNSPSAIKASASVPNYLVLNYDPGNPTGAQIDCEANIWSDYVDTAHNTNSELVDLDNGLLKVLTLDLATGELLAEDGTVVAILDRPDLISYPQGC